LARGLLRVLLDFAIPQQERDNWCWAACASGVARFYDDTTAWTQCGIANAVLGRSDCCVDGGQCDEAAAVYKALNATGNLAWKLDRPATRDELLRELGQGRPIVARIQWPHREGYPEGHFVVIDGYRPPGLFRVQDPAGQRTLELRLDRLMHRFDALGWWSHSYGTSP